MYKIYNVQYVQNSIKKFFASKHLLSVYVLLYYISVLIVTAYRDIATYCGLRILSLPRTVLSLLTKHDFCMYEH